ncbi:MAG: hypothetical protein KDA31_03875 [Phycisphaerales bacterium]|nr:hypothetical protein [Phycisphaerales bacterium]MCB9835950.1 hypothetical protein [Phycisphaera sp.]
MKRTRSSIAFTLAVIAGSTFGQVASEPKSYEGQQVIRVTHHSGEELARVLELTESLWSEGVGRGPVDVQMSRENVELLRKEGIELEVVVDDLQADAERERAEIAAKRAVAHLGGDAIDYSNYYPFADHVAFMNQLVGERPDLASISTIGQSLQGNPIWTVNATGPGDASNRPQVAINATIHAREWITSPAAEYLLESLVRDYDSNPRIRNLMDTVDWYVTPVFNVDGYLYSWSTERYWRKNRRNNGNGTFGVDLNRNWDIDWGGNGASSNTSDETYRGTSAFSEPETQVMRDFLLTLDDLRAHVDTHSYSQLVLHAPGTFAQVTPNQAALQAVAEDMSDAILATNGAFYTPQRGVDLYEAAGAFSDWTGLVLGAFGFTIEARPTGGGLNGFSPPASDILPAAEEINAAYLVMAELRTQPLRFVLPESAYATFQQDESRSIVFSVLGALNNPAASGVKVFARQSGSGSFTEITATSMGNGMYGATLNAGDCDTTVEFYLQAMTTTGTVVDFPANGATVPIVADVTADMLVFSDNGETDPGWTVSGNATDGQWQRAIPANFGRSDPTTDFDGSGRCWLTDNGESNSDVDGGVTILTSPVFDVSSGGTVNYAYWMNDETNTIGAEDYFRVEVSTDGGSNWSIARNYTTSGSWRTDSIDIGSEFGNTSQLRIRFAAAENDPGDVLECAVDAISIVVPGECGTTCVADTNGDGILSPADFSAWVAAFNAMSPACDQNADGVCSPADFSAWVANYNAGCN